MTDLLGRLFVKDHKNTSDKTVRRSWGTLVSIVGIIANVLLFAGKFIVGTVFGVLSISADAVNNLSDAASQLISLFSFRIAAKPADKEHPFGHARMEYVASMIVSVLIIIIGFSSLRDSFDKVLHPEESVFSWISVGVLAASILVKLWLAFFNKNVARRIQSTVMEATAADSLSDVLATSAVLISLLVFKFTGWDPDAYLGCLVSLLIMWAGIKIMKEMMDLLVGETPDPVLIKEITDFVLAHDGILGVHDMMVHGYGPRCSIVSLHAEVDGAADIFETHDLIDNIENEMLEKFGIVATIHMDPIVTGDESIDRLREAVLSKMHEIDERLKIHDFRVVRGTTHTNVLFDIAAPFEVALTDDELKAQATAKLRELDPKYNLVTKIDRGINDV